MRQRTGFELPAGIVATYFIFKLWWSGWFASAGIEFFQPEFAFQEGALMGAEQLYGDSIFGKLFIEAINLMVGIGTIVIWAATGILSILKDVFAGVGEAIGYSRSIDWPFLKKQSSSQDASEITKAIDPGTAAYEDAKRIELANELIAAAIEGRQTRVINAAESLHGKKFFRQAKQSTSK